jgi:hypothetical protein
VSAANSVTQIAELGSDMAQAFGRTHHANTLVYLTRFDEAEQAVEKAMAFAERTGQLPFLSELKSETHPALLLRRGEVAALRMDYLQQLCGFTEPSSVKIRGSLWARTRSKGHSTSSVISMSY